MAGNTYNVKVGIDARGAKKGARQYNRSADDISRASREMEQRVNRASASINRVGKSGQLLKGVITGIGIGGLAAAFSSSTRAALDFSGAMDEVMTLTSATFGPTDMLADEVKRLSSEYGNAPVDTAKALYQVISAGAGDATQAVERLDAANRLAIGGVTDVATAADGLTSIMNAYGDTAKNTEDVTDAMFVAMKAGKTTIGELSASIGNVAPLTAQLGISFEEVLGATAALTKAGVSTSQAMNGLKAAMANVVKPTKQASDIAMKLGIDFSAAGLAAAGSMEEFLNQIKAAGGGSVEVLGQLFGSIEGLNAMLALTGSASKDFNLIMGDMATKAGATTTAYETIAGGAAQQFQAATNNLRIVMIELGEAIIEFLLPAITWFNDNIETVMGTVKLLTLLLAGRLAASLANAVISFVGVGTAATGASAGVTLLNNALKLVGGPIGLLILAVTGLVAAYAFLKDDLEEMASLPQPVTDALDDLREATEKEPTGVAVGEAIQASMLETEAAILNVRNEMADLEEEISRRKGLQEAFLEQAMSGEGHGTGFAMMFNASELEDAEAALEAYKLQNEGLAVAQEALTFRQALFRKELGDTDAVLAAFNNLSVEAQAAVRATGLSFGEAAAAAKKAKEETESYTNAKGETITITKTENRLLNQLTKKYLETAQAQIEMAKATELIAKLSTLSDASLAKMGLTSADLESLMVQLKAAIEEARLESELNAMALTTQEKATQALLMALFPVSETLLGVSSDFDTFTRAMGEGWESSQQGTAILDAMSKKYGLTAKQMKGVATGVGKLSKEMGRGWQATAKGVGALEALAEELEISEEAMEKLKDVLKGDPFDPLFELRELEKIIDPSLAAVDDLAAKLDTLKKVQEALGKDDDWYNMMAEGLNRAVGGAESLASSMERVGSLAGDALREIQSSVSNGSKAYEALNVAIQAANVVSAIGAVLNQANGDPYTAFARMAAMAAAVAALGVSIGNISGGGFSDPTEQRQAEQGTGSVLGDMEAKSESIRNSIEITASATSELVGINRGMLTALQEMLRGITGATTSIARGSGFDGFVNKPDVDISAGETLGKIGGLLIGGIVGFFVGGFVGKLFDKLLGGKAKIVDEGVAILAGSLDDLIGGTLIKAFQDIKYKKWRFGSKKERTELVDLEGDAAAQIGLVFQAMSDAVYAGAIALGMSSAEVETALDSFRIAAQKISLEDLSAEEQQKEIEAVFSQIFDDLAMHVVPFIADFQKVGEGLGETLIRVATSVQVMQEAITQFGWTIGDLDVEQFAKMSVALIEMTGGIDQFINKFSSFIDKFATEEHKFNMAQDQLTRAFAQMGLELPATAEGMWELMQSLDATTEEGQAQIALLLELTDVASSYYNTLDERQREAIRIQEEAARAREAALQAEVDALLHIQSLAESVAGRMQSLRDMIMGDLNSDKQNYNVYKSEAEQLAKDLLTMTDPVMIESTVAKIESLIRSAYGLLDDEQKATVGKELLAFIDGVEERALAVLEATAENIIASSDFTPEELLAEFNAKVSDPLILAGTALSDAATLLQTAASEFYIYGPQANTGLEDIEDAGVAAGDTDNGEDTMGAIVSEFGESTAASNEAMIMAAEILSVAAENFVEGSETFIEGVNHFNGSVTRFGVAASQPTEVNINVNNEYDEIAP